jgi:hypothetical protein
MNYFWCSNSLFFFANFASLRELQPFIGLFLLGIKHKVTDFFKVRYQAVRGVIKAACPEWR